MIGVFGNRANSVGVSALLIMVLNIDRHHEGWEVVINAGYVLAGGLWYMLLSLVLYSFRPYKLAQQALGDCIIATAEYMRVRATFYEKKWTMGKPTRKCWKSRSLYMKNKTL